MKKLIIKYNILILLLTISFGCQENFLERYPLDALSSETYWRNEADLRNYNNSLYDKVKHDDNYPIMLGLSRGAGVNFKEGIWWQDQMSDNLAPTHGRAREFFEIRAGKHQISNAPRLTGYKGWDLIRDINFGLENYDRAEISETIINRYKAEARLFRAWFYAEKVSKFGDVEWVDKILTIESEELYGPRTPREQVMDNVLADLDFAIANLPEEWGDGQNPGRMDKWVALAIKSRYALFEGTWRKYHGGSNADAWLTEAVNASKELMDDGGFSLYSTGKPDEDYRHHMSALTQEGNPEVIYWRKYEALVNGHFASRLFWNYNGGATKSFVEDALCEDGLPISLSPLYQGDADIETLFQNRDLRLRQCVLHPEDQEKWDYARDAANTYPRITGMNGGRNKSNTGYHVVKHWNAIDEGSPRNQHTASPPCLRLGEIYLNFAEAKAELGTLTQGDLDISINLLRDRVNMAHLDINPPMDPRYASDGISAIVVEVRRERRIELFLEGHRYHDLRRWKQGKYLAMSDYGMLWDAAAEARYPGANVETTMIDGKPYIDVRKGTDWEPEFNDAKHYLWPIPTNVISQNPNIAQNPGWQ
ncbi:MAG: RagB/SusD family nutrient uptake outer membrane protein [Cyclobacteriaceae bacterium]